MQLFSPTDTNLILQVESKNWSDLTKQNQKTGRLTRIKGNTSWDAYCEASLALMPPLPQPRPDYFGSAAARTVWNTGSWLPFRSHSLHVSFSKDSLQNTHPHTLAFPVLFTRKLFLESLVK